MKKFAIFSVLLSCVFAVALLPSRAQTAQEIGIDRSNLLRLSEADQEKTLEGSHALHATWFRDVFITVTPQDVARFVNEVRRAKQNDLKFLANVLPARADFDKGYQPDNAGEDFHRRCGWPQGSPRVSRINLAKFSQRFRTQLNGVKAANVTIDAFAQRVAAHGIKIVWLVGLPPVPGTPWPHAPEGFKGLWQGYPLSAIDPDQFRKNFEPMLAKLEAKGIVLEAFEPGNEINWAGFNADFSLPGEGRVLGASDLTNDPEGKRVAKGYLQYLKLLEALKDIRDHSKLNRHTPIISAGLADLGSGGWPQKRKADAVSLSATLGFLRANGLDKLVDGYGIHDYPPSSKPGTSEGAAARRSYLGHNASECQPPGSATGKPCWFTEWGLGGISGGCPVDDTNKAKLIREMGGYYSQLALFLGTRARPLPPAHCAFPL